MEQTGVEIFLFEASRGGFQALGCCVSPCFNSGIPVLVGPGPHIRYICHRVLKTHLIKPGLGCRYLEGGSQFVVVLAKTTEALDGLRVGTAFQWMGQLD